MATDAPPAPRLNPPPTTPSPGKRLPGDAELRITRQFAIFIGAGYLAYMLLCLHNIAASFHYMDSWWAAPAPIAVFGSGIAVAVVAAVGARHLIRPAIVVAVICYVVAALLVPIAWKHGMYSDERGLWFSQFPGLVGVAIGLGWPRARAIAYLAILTSISSLMSRVVRPSELLVPLVADLAFAFAYSLPFTVAVMIGVRTSRILDETRAQTFDLAGQTAAARARAAERRRFDALTHDGVMTVLLGAARLGTTDSIRRLAARTITELGDAHDGSTAVPAAAAIATLQSTVTDIDDTTTFTVERQTPLGLTTFRQDVVRTMAAAMAEALRNSLRHAGSAATTAVRVDVATDRIAITVIDDGQGFDVAAIPPHRLGIAVSIRGRMDQLDGCDVDIHSVPGGGTSVRLTWTERS